MKICRQKTMGKKGATSEQIADLVLRRGTKHRKEAAESCAIPKANVHLRFLSQRV